MTPYELLDFIVSISNRIDVQWGLFITIHLALFGGLLYSDRPLNRLQKITATVSYSLFAFFNFRILRFLYATLEPAFHEVVKWSSDPCCMGNELIQHYSGLLEGGFFQRIAVYTVTVHVIAALVFFWTVIFVKDHSANKSMA